MKAAFKIFALFILLGLGPVFGDWNASTICSIRTYDGHYLTAVGGGGRTTDVLHTDATRMGTWETFRVTSLSEGSPLVSIQTYTGHYLSAQGGGGGFIDAIHSNRTQLLNWEIFKLIPLADEWYGIQTYNGHYLWAVFGGGRTTGPVIVAHIQNISRATKWGMFKFNCRPDR